MWGGQGGKGVVTPQTLAECTCGMRCIAYNYPWMAPSSEGFWFDRLGTGQLLSSDCCSTAARAPSSLLTVCSKLLLHMYSCSWLKHIMSAPHKITIIIMSLLLATFWPHTNDWSHGSTPLESVAFFSLFCWVYSVCCTACMWFAMNWFESIKLMTISQVLLGLDFSRLIISTTLPARFYLP
jgi:hypothetical protein